MEIRTNEVTDVYSSNQPQLQLDKRIKFCMEIYNDSVKALEFPKKEEKKIDFNLDDDDDMQDEAELVEAMMEDYDDL
jgi:26S proteasome regulatory subunit N3